MEPLTLSRPYRQFAALALLVGALAFVVLVTIAPVAARISGLREQVDTERALLGRFAAVAAQQSQAAEYDRIGRAAVESGAYLKGENESLKVAGLQTTLAELAGANGMRLYSTRALPAREREATRLIGVRVQFNGDITQVRALLHRIEMHQPFLFIEAVQIAPTSPFSQRDPEQNGLLDVRLDVFGAIPLKRG